MSGIIHTENGADTHKQYAFSTDLDAEIEEWVSIHLAASPEWDEQRWVELGELLGVDFTAKPE